MKWNEVGRKVQYLLNFEEAPDLLIIHCGGNDIGDPAGSNCELRHKMFKTIQFLRNLLPSTRIIWSQILPRLKWRDEICHEALEKARIRTNSFIATIIIQSGGAYIRYPEIVELNTGMFSDDNVHLSDIGNEIFLYRIQQAICAFVTSDTFVSPPPGESGPWLNLI